MSASVTVQLDMASVYAAYARLGQRAGKNMIRRALRAALIPVRETQRGAWSSAAFRSGRTTKKVKRNAGMFKRTRVKRARPVVVRKAVARAITVKVDRMSDGQFVAGVGIDYAKSGVQSQQRVAHILEGGRVSPKLDARRVLEGVNKAAHQQVGRRFIEYVQKELANGA